ncbi:hypothetical protein [Lacibacter sp.]|uniref:hypothetical protein n=1 Tax=Lacibacter sp. TaxID=1915409 RepID=UPI002B4B107C|nr:hypothetical protein [Lacibacter sp.]HLP38483.1 hypothetical protein [Lacibacter sp.]
MTYIERYLNGETKEVYKEITDLGQEAFYADNFTQIDFVLQETFKRVAFNLNIIYQELKNIGYQFTSDIKYDWQQPLLPPDPNTEILLSELKSKIRERGHIPLSLEYFYKIVGSCNFCWDWGVSPVILWEGADPIDIPPIKDLLEMVYDDYDCEDILISGDYLQKDNVSGSCYNIELTATPAVDSLLHGWDIPFIEYLRLTFKNCGFTMADQCNYESLTSFCNTVKPKLKEI